MMYLGETRPENLNPLTVLSGTGGGGSTSGYRPGTMLDNTYRTLQNKYGIDQGGPTLDEGSWRVLTAILGARGAGLIEKQQDFAAELEPQRQRQVMASLQALSPKARQVMLDKARRKMLADARANAVVREQAMRERGMSAAATAGAAKAAEEEGQIRYQDFENEQTSPEMMGATGLGNRRAARPDRAFNASENAVRAEGR